MSNSSKEKAHKNQFMRTFQRLLIKFLNPNNFKSRRKQNRLVKTNLMKLEKPKKKKNVRKKLRMKQNRTRGHQVPVLLKKTVKMLLLLSLQETISIVISDLF